MSNAFIAAIDARIEVAAQRESSVTNIKKLQAMRALFAQADFAALMIDAQVDAERLMRAIYASEKVVKFAHHAVERIADRVNENAFAAFKTAMQLHAAKLNVTKRDIEASLSKDVAIDDERAKYVYRRNAILDQTTINAQSQQCIDMLKTLNILKSDHARATFYEVTRNALADKLCEKLNIQTVSAD